MEENRRNYLAIYSIKFWGEDYSYYNLDECTKRARWPTWHQEKKSLEALDDDEARKLTENYRLTLGEKYNLDSSFVKLVSLTKVRELLPS